MGHAKLCSLPNHVVLSDTVNELQTFRTQDLSFPRTKGPYGELSFPGPVVVNSVNVFKARLDRFWMDQDVKFDFTADLTGTGDRSVNVISET